MNEELWKNGKLNEEYVDLIYKAFKKIDGNIGSEFLREGAKGKKELLSPTLANRAKAALLAQPDLAFYKKLKKYNTEAWKRYQDGNPNYYHVPLKKAKFQRDPKTSANA